MSRCCAALLCALALACDPPGPDRPHAGDIALIGGHSYSPVGSEAAAYVTLQNIGRLEDTLLGVGSPIADTVTLHDSRQEGGTVRMIEVGPLVMPPGLVVQMEPGGLHLMLLHLRVTMQAGRNLPLRLWFAHNGMLEIDIPISRYGDPH